MKRIVSFIFLFLLLSGSALTYSQSASAHGSKYFRTCTTGYDCCYNACYKMVTTFKCCKVRYQGSYCDDCGCPKCYTYCKTHYYPVKSVKCYYCRQNTCCDYNNSCNYNSGCCDNACRDYNYTGCNTNACCN